MAMEVFARGAMKEAFERIASVAKNHASVVLKLEEEIVFLRTILPQVKELVLNAEAQIFLDSGDSKPDTRDFLKGLKEFVYDAEDILDEFDTEVGRRRLIIINGEEQQQNRVARWLMAFCFFLRPVCGCFPAFSSLFDGELPLFIRIKIANKIKGLYDEFEKIKDRRQRIEVFVKEAMGGLEDKGDGGAASNTGSGSSTKRPVTKAMLNKDFRMVGRDGVKERVMEDLLGPKSKLLAVVVTGMGGVGKTTLAQDIFRDPKMDEHFQCKKWVCLGDGERDVERVMGKILREHDQARGMGKISEDIKANQEDIQSAVKNKRLLIVLDDVWKGNLRRDQFDVLWTPLSYGDARSRVIITTRQEDVVKELGSVDSEIHRLSPLANKDCLEILQRSAFPNGFPSTSSGSSRLEDIAREVVEKKVKGLPLAAKVIGSSLRNETNESTWRRVLQDIDENDKKHIMSVLKWSYLRLPSHLKQCFSFWSLYPKDWEMPKSWMVSLWIAHGYVVQPKGGGICGQSLEEIGESYLDDLVKASLIQHVGHVVHKQDDSNDDDCNDDHDGGHSGDCYGMHDLIHDFAMAISGGDRFFKVKGDKTESNTVQELQALHHLVCGYSVELPQNYSHIKKLRTFMTSNPSHVNILSDQLKTVRVLRLEGVACGDKLNESFTKMMHLRFLCISNLSIDAIPNSLCSLYNLQDLILPEKQVQLPDGMWKIVHLRHLWAGYYTSRITRIGELTLLQTIGDKFCLFKDNGQCIRELRNLRQLRGMLEIVGLRHVKRTQWACDAQLENKVHLQGLVLDTIYEEDVDENTHLVTENNTLEIEIFNSFRPHRDLKELQIKNYHGYELPTWMRGNHLLNIVSLTLVNCNSLKKLPPLGHLCILENLKIENANKIELIDKEFYGTDRDPMEVFPSLKELSLEGMDVLEEWEELIVSGDKSQKKYFPSLKRLHVERCEKLGCLPHIPLSLEVLEIERVGLTVLPKVWGCCSNNDEGEESTHNYGGLQFLRRLYLNSCPVSIVNKWFHRMPSISLVRLYDIGCFNLTLSSYDKLVELTLSNVRNLESLQIQNAILLKLLLIDNCENLQQIYLSHLPSLNEMVIRDCDSINEIPGLQDLPALRIMEFFGAGTSKVKTTNYYALQNLESLETNSWEFLQTVDPHSLVELTLWYLNFDRDVSYDEQKWALSWFPKLSSVREIHIEEANGSSWPPYIEVQGLHSLQKLHLTSCKDLQDLPELPSSLEENGLTIMDCPLLQFHGNAA